MALISTAPSVMEALYQALAASTDYSGMTPPVQVAESFPGQDQIRDLAVFLGDVRTHDIHIPVSRAVRVVREENYVVDVHCQAYRAGSNAKAARETAFQLYQGVEDVLAANPTLGLPGIGVIKCYTTGYEMQTGLYNDGWIAFIKVEVAVQARLY